MAIHPRFSWVKSSVYSKMVSHEGAKINTQNHQEKPKKLLLSIALIGMESIGIWLLFLQSVYSAFAGDSSNLLASIFLSGFLFFAGLWTSNIALGLLKLKRWSLTAGVVLQFLIGSIAAASFAGEFGNAVIGIALLLPSATALFILLSKNVRYLFTAG